MGYSNDVPNEQFREQLFTYLRTCGDRLLTWDEIPLNHQATLEWWATQPVDTQLHLEDYLAILPHSFVQAWFTHSPRKILLWHKTLIARAWAIPAVTTRLSDLIKHGTTPELIAEHYPLYRQTCETLLDKLEQLGFPYVKTHEELTQTAKEFAAIYIRQQATNRKEITPL